MDKILTGNIWKKVRRYFVQEEPKIACVAYVHTTGIDLQEGDLLICDASEDSIAWNRTSAKILKDYHQRGVIIYSHDCLHAKFLCSRSMLVLGSANLSGASETELRESAILTDSLVLCSQAKVLCNTIKKEATQLSSGMIDELCKIKVHRRPRRRKGVVRKSVNIKGDKCWYMPVLEMSATLIEKVDNETASERANAARRENVPLENISWIRTGIKPFFSNIQEGDQVIRKFTSRQKNKSWLYAPVTIIQIKPSADQKFLLLYFDTVDDYYISWSAYLRLAKKDQLLKNRVRQVSLPDAKQIKGWVGHG